MFHKLTDKHVSRLNKCVSQIINKYVSQLDKRVSQLNKDVLQIDKYVSQRRSLKQFFSYNGAP